jgi:hypothetical protein
MGKALCAVVAFAAVTALVIGSGGEAGAGRGPCAVPRGYHLLKRSRHAIVVERDRRPRHVYGCHFPTDRMVRLTPYSPIYRLAGHFAAYRDFFGDALQGGRQYHVDIMDLKRGTLRYGAAVYSYSGPMDDGTISGTITGLTLKRDGSVAWISCRTGSGRDSPCRAHARRQVWRSDSYGDARLDDSRRVFLYSLRRRGSTISWRHGAGRRSARLR